MSKINNRIRVLAFCLGLLIGGLPAYAATAGGYSGHQAIAGDFNGDGWTDLILQPTGGNQGVAEFIAFPDGNFGPPLATWHDKSGGTDWNADAHRLVVGDFNGDGRDDVLLQGAAGLPSQIAYAQSDGSVKQTNYEIPSSLDGLDVSQANHHIVVGDFNGDGREDILLQANTFVGTNAIALATPNGQFNTLASTWQDGYKGVSWSLDHSSIAAGDFSGQGKDELLVRSDSSTGTSGCCSLMSIGSNSKPDQIEQHWPSNYLGVNWNPSTDIAIVGDFNGDGRDDVLLQPVAVGAELAVVLSNPAGHLAILSDHWSSDRNGIDWSAQSYQLVPEHAAAGQGATLLMVPKQAGLPYRRATFDTQGHLVSVNTIAAPPSQLFTGTDGAGTAAGALPMAGAQPMAATINSTTSGNTVGTMNGQASVSGGVAGYSIKVSVPPGRHGMAPSLSLGYSSNGGDGPEGVGWSLSGFSSIYRCPATWATDGVTRGVTFTSGNNGDRFCLDGQKLILTSGKYGADGSVYHTEINGFSKIVAYGAQGNGPQYFTIHTPGNNTLYYGDTANSRLKDNSTSDSTSVFSWGIEKSVDAYGNEVQYTYSNNVNTGEMYPVEIDYTLGNGSPGSTRKVKLSWAVRSGVSPDIIHYLAGMRQTTGHLLSQIQTWVGGTEVRDYALSYGTSPATDRPLLNSVQVCAFQNGVKSCFNPTTFSCQGQQAPSYATSSGAAVGLVDNTQPGACHFSRYGEWTPMDVNGDGRTDLVYNSNFSATLGNYVQYAEPGGTFSSAQTMPGSYKPSYGERIDFNLDGRTDLPTWLTLSTTTNEQDISFLYKLAGNNTWQSKDTGIHYYPTSSADPEQIVDFNGDGKPDIVVNSCPSTSCQWQFWEADVTKIGTSTGLGVNTTYKEITTLAASGSPAQMQSFDYAANGLGDILFRGVSGYYKILMSEPGSSGTPTFKIVTTNVPVIGLANSPNQYENAIVADVNGDSLPDLLEVKNGDWWVYLNTGNANGQFVAYDTGKAGPTVAGQGLQNFVHTIRDPDGRTDLIVPTTETYISPTLQKNKQVNNECLYPARSDTDPPSKWDGYDWEILRITGNGVYTGFSMTQVGSNPAVDNLRLGSIRTFDTNADGLEDISGALGTDVTLGSNKANIVLTRYKGSVPDLMTQVTNGLGVQNTVTYAPISQTSVYVFSSGTTYTYPLMRFTSTMQVVSQLTTTNPVGGTDKTDYHYQDAAYNVAGRGFVGFRTITSDAQVDDALDDTSTTTTFHQNFPYIGRILTQSSSPLSGGSAFSETTNTWKDNPHGTTNAKYYDVYAGDSTQTSTDPTDGTLINQSTSTESNVDMCGNATQSGGSTTTQQATTTVSSSATYLAPNSADTCWEDVLSSSTVTQGVNYGALSVNSTPAVSDSLTTTTAYTYNADYSVASKDVKSSHNESAERFATYGYDQFGNRNLVTAYPSSTSTSGRQASTSYGTDGYFPVSVTKGGFTSYLTYDPDTGNKIEAKDPNLIWTKYAYDAFGRKLGGQSEGQSAVVGQYLDATAVSCPSGGPNTAAYALETTQVGYPTKYTCFDAYGDAIRSATEGFDSGWVAVDSTYNDLGQLLTKTIPYEGQSALDKAQYGGYDILGRLKSKKIPTMKGSRTVKMSYSGLTITYNDTDNYTGITHVYKHFYDGLGKGNGHLVEVQQQKKNGNWVTSTYRYDAGGNLIQATDSAGNAITATYDGFGDKLTLNDPDQGKSTYTYDGYGEQITSTNGRGQTITTYYDVLGRPTKVSDPADNRVTTTTYDQGPDAIGKLVKETVSKNGTVVYTRQYAYDQAGRQRATKITTGGVSYLQGVGYDSDGRADAQAYPAMGGGVNSGGPALSASANPAGPVNLNKTVQLHATASDPNGDWALSYHWTQTGGPSTAISYADTADASVTLPTAGTYIFQVTVSDGFNMSTQSVSIKAEPPPSASVTPIFSANPSYTGSYRVSWGSIQYADTYKLQQSADGGSTWTTNTTSSLYVDESGHGVGQYIYRVQGCNPVGCGPWGGEATEKVEAPAGSLVIGLSPNPSSTGAYTVKWGSVNGATSYELQQCTSVSKTWTTKQDNGATSWNPSGEGNGAYEYRVRACNTTTGCGAWSATATEEVYLPPGASSLTVSPSSVYTGANYKLSWTVPSGEVTEYQLEEQVGSTNFSGVTPQNMGMATSVTYTGASPDITVYYYRERGCNHGFCGPWSNTVSERVTNSGGGGGCRLCSPTLNTQTTATTTATQTGGTGAMVVDTSYTGTGYPDTLKRQSDGYVYMHVSGMDAWGHATQVYEGGTSSSTAAVSMTRVDDPSTGQVTSITAGDPVTNSTIAKVTSAWDGFGNMTSRSEVTADMSGTSTETATYDLLNRLTGSTTTLPGGAGTSTRSYTYDDTGNRTQACTDTQCTDFSYGQGIGVDGAGPHAVSTVNAVTSGYAYNLNGEMTQDNGRTLTWTAFGKAYSIAKGSTTVNFSYGPGNSRYKKVVTGIGNETVTYLGGAEVLDVGGGRSIRRTLGFAGLTVIDTGGANAGVHYALPDHLGSVMALVDSSGNLKQSLSYGNFGKRYGGGWISPLTTNQAWTINTTMTDKGYTGQESLDSVGLDDYNARLYDPTLGRFLSTDPLISKPGSTQSINPYSYVENNPLNKTDPTGEFGLGGGGLDAIDIPTHIHGSANPNSSTASVELSNLPSSGSGGKAGNKSKGSGGKTGGGSKGGRGQGATAHAARGDNNSHSGGGYSGKSSDSTGGVSPTLAPPAAGSSGLGSSSGFRHGMFNFGCGLVNGCSVMDSMVNKDGGAYGAGQITSILFAPLVALGIVAANGGPANPEGDIEAGTFLFGTENAQAAVDLPEALTAGGSEGDIPIGTNLTRSFGGESDLYRQSWTTDPVGLQSRNSLGLETNNSAEFVAHGTVIDNTGITTREAEEWGRFAGGGQETLIPNSKIQVQIRAVTMPDKPLPWYLPTDPKP